VVIDIPYADQGKVKTEQAARELADLFERTGAAIGLVVKAFATPGNAPIGRGIGPALEARDVMRVLDNDPLAPDDLRNKALFFAGQILALDPEISDVKRGMARAEQLLRSGSARQKMQEIIAAQGPVLPPHGQVLTHEVKSSRSGLVKAILGHVISNVARAAGAPQSPLAGVDLIKKIGDEIQAGEVLYVIQGTNEAALVQARQLAHQHEAYVMAGESV
jgi:thymidine phosphorylase